MPEKKNFSADLKNLSEHAKEALTDTLCQIINPIVVDVLKKENIKDDLFQANQKIGTLNTRIEGIFDEVKRLSDKLDIIEEKMCNVLLLISEYNNNKPKDVSGKIFALGVVSVVLSIVVTGSILVLLVR